jgi:RNA polymerase sigma factor (sigma-70 family)
MSLGLAAVPLDRPRLSVVSPNDPLAADRAALDYSTLLDEQLLARFFGQREDAAFAALVERHGPLVYGVCSRVLRDVNDAQDAFQATFLVLVRKGETLSEPGRLANWLFGVAYRTARKVRTRAVTRTRHERAAPLPAATEVDSMTLSELKAILDEEIAALPEKYALPLVLCYLEGRTNGEAAAQLGWPEGSMSRRLARARELLKARLVQRGLALSAALLAALFAKPLVAAPPPELVEATVCAGNLVLQGVPLKEVVSGQSAAVARDVVGGLVPPAKLALAAFLATASVLVAVAMGVWQFSPPAGDGAFSVFQQAACGTLPPYPAAAPTDLSAACGQCQPDGRWLANPPPPAPVR